MFTDFGQGFPMLLAARQAIQIVQTAQSSNDIPTLTSAINILKSSLAYGTALLNNTGSSLSEQAAIFVALGGNQIMDYSMPGSALSGPTRANMSNIQSLINQLGSQLALAQTAQVPIQQQLIADLQAQLSAQNDLLNTIAVKQAEIDTLNTQLADVMTQLVTLTQEFQTVQQAQAAPSVAPPSIPMVSAGGGGGGGMIVPPGMVQAADLAQQQADLSQAVQSTQAVIADTSMAITDTSTQLDLLGQEANVTAQIDMTESIMTGFDQQYSDQMTLLDQLRQELATGVPASARVEITAPTISPVPVTFAPTFVQPQMIEQPVEFVPSDQIDLGPSDQIIQSGDEIMQSDEFSGFGDIVNMQKVPGIAFSKIPPAMYEPVLSYGPDPNYVEKPGSLLPYVDRLHMAKPLYKPADLFHEEKDYQNPLYAVQDIPREIPSRIAGYAYPRFEAKALETASPVRTIVRSIRPNPVLDHMINDLQKGQANLDNLIKQYEHYMQYDLRFPGMIDVRGKVQSLKQQVEQLGNALIGMKKADPKPFVQDDIDKIKYIKQTIENMLHDIEILYSELK